MRVFWLVIALSLTLLARAQSLEDAQELFAAGKYLEASKMSAALGSSASLTFAAYTLGVHAGDQPTDKQEALFAQCEQYARKALELNKGNADAHAQLGVALGRLSGLRGAAYAFLNGMVGQVRGSFERALELNPRQVIALIGLGRLHAELVSRGVGAMFGAEAALVKPLFERAVQADPKGIGVRLEYARALTVLDAAANRAQIKKLLEAAADLTPRDALERRQLAAVERLLVK
jgi:hypothetical protein